MNPAALIPAPDSIPVPWGWFQVLLLATTGCHFLLMNMVLGGTLLALILRRRPVGPGPVLAPRLPTGLALAVNFGIPPLLFLQVLYGQFLYSASVLSATWWMAVTGLAMLAYALLYRNAFQAKKHPGLPAPFVTLGLAATALLAVSFIMSNIMTLMLRPETWDRYFTNPHGTLLNLSDPTLLPRWLHFVLASLAVGGLFVALTQQRAAARGDAAARYRLDQGLRWFTHASLGQAAAGIWWLLALPQPVMLRFMGGSPLPTALFLVALAAASLAVGLGFKGRPRAAALALVPTVFLMAGLRDIVRTAMLEPYFSPGTLTVTGQYGSLYLFLGSAVAGAAALAWIWRAHRQSGGGI